jgi:mannose-1-phosphate guanylyltransferase
MASAMILAAGLGTRLRPLTDLVPKPLVPIGDRPMLAHVVERVRAAGCAPVVANAFHHGEALARFCEEQRVAVSAEDDLLGTAGGIARAGSLLGGGDVLVHNGDVLVSASLEGLLAAHAERSAGATLVVVPRKAGEGNVGFDASGAVVRLRTETFAEGESSGGEFTGVHVVGARVRDGLPERGCIVGDVYMPRLRGKIADLYVYPASDFVDVGSPAGYLGANLAWLAARDLDSLLGDDVTLAPHVTLDTCIVGDGATIEGEGVLARCVVWPNATVTAPLSDSIVTPTHSMQVTWLPSAATR